MRANDVKPPLKVQFPATLQPDATGADLYGYFHPETHHVLVLPPEAPLEGSINLSRGADAPGLMASHQPTGWIFSAMGRTCIAEPYELDLSLFSRHLGLLQASAMRECGMADVGRFKAQAVADRIRLINPLADVQVHSTTLERLDPAVVEAFTTAQNQQGERLPTLLLAAADSRRADRYGARLAAQLQLAFLSIGLWERAFSGELFYWHPDTPMPCYGCAFEGLGNALSQRAEAKRRFYSNEHELPALDFQPGIAIDIAYVVQVGLKLAIDLLNRHNPRHVPRLLGHLSQYTLVCNSNDGLLGGEAAEIFSHPLQVTTSLKVGYRQDCSACGGSP